MNGRDRWWLRKRHRENLPMDAIPDEEDTDESSAAWENEIRKVNRNLEMQPSSSSSLAQPRDEATCSQPVEMTHARQTNCAKSVRGEPNAEKESRGAREKSIKR